jgi:hypothetical protein
MRLALRIAALIVATALVSFPAPVARAAASFAADQQVVGPLAPTVVNVNVSDYTGSATLLVFDPLKRIVGSWQVSLRGGYGAVQVAPRGALGAHWAALFVDGQQVASGTLYTLVAQTTVQTGVPYIDALVPAVRGMLESDKLTYRLDGQPVHGYRSGDSNLLWLRDHFYQGRAYRYFEPDVTSALDAFRRLQQPDGSILDVLPRPDVAVAGFRTPVEADVEYLYAQAVVDAWRIGGNDGWLRSMLPSAQRAISYTLTSPLRWDPWVQLVKRPFTIDTWDYEYGPTTVDPASGQPAPRHWIDDQTKWGIFHGDNTGLAQALRSLASAEEYLGQPAQARFHRETADGIVRRLNELSWNGRFFRHHVKLQPFDAPGVIEEQQLSLSNALALNRGVLTPDQAQAMIEEYRGRLRRPGNISFAEWWSIDPPFPEGSFGLAGRIGEKPGQYVNGGIMPLVGGELARGAFRLGLETYGFDTLQRYEALTRATIPLSTTSFLWYYPTGGAGIGSHETIATDGWGSAAMLGALMEGAAGVEDNGVRYSDATLSPRWPAEPGVRSAYVVARYAASDGYVAYRWAREEKELNVEATGSGGPLRLRLLLPAAAQRGLAVRLNGQPAPAQLEALGTSRYLLVNANGPVVQVQVTWR